MVRQIVDRLRLNSSAGYRRAMGGQIWRDHLYVSVLQQTPDPSPIVWISPKAVKEHGGTTEWAGGWRHLATVPSPSPTSRRFTEDREPGLSADGGVALGTYLHPIEGQLELGAVTAAALARSDPLLS
jgi:hypothetical protein